MVNVNIRDRQCAVPECSKYPSCNFPGSTDGLYCGALDGPAAGRGLSPRLWAPPMELCCCMRWPRGTL
jgi:hypothetical protein